MFVRIIKPLQQEAVVTFLSVIMYVHGSYELTVSASVRNYEGFKEDPVPCSWVIIISPK
jgi:hypothetical protein